MLRRLVFQVGWHLHRLVYRLTAGRAAGAGTLELRTVGRRTGEPRMTLLHYLPDGDRLLVVASNAGGARDPAWWLNLAARPAAEVVLAGAVRPVTAREAVGTERDSLWGRLTVWNPDYADYQRRSGRRVPVVILEPREEMP
jgi:F420H(2)-dependent quinone reductase